MNDSADVSLYAERRAAFLLGIAPVEPGVGTRAFWKKRVQLDSSFPPSGRICGVFQYTGVTPNDDKIIVFKDGEFYRCTVSANAPTGTVNALNFTSTQLVAINDDSGVTFDGDSRVRAVQIGSEMFFVQEGGVTPVRYNGTDILRLGIVPPAAPTDAGNLAGGPLQVNATYLYAVTYEDELGRESSPSDYLTVVMGAGGGRTINWAAPTDAQVQRVYLYRSTALAPGSTAATLYRVVEDGFNTATTTWGDNAMSDTLIVFNTPAPLPGQNDPPADASVISAYKSRLALNDADNPRTLQISNLEEYGSFSQLGPINNPNGQVLNATDGITFEALNEFGDEITALGHLGSVLGVWNRRTTGIFQGDFPGEYQFRIVHRIGCIAPDSVCECGNATAFMAEDGVYALDYQSGFSITKLSEDFNNYFTSASVLWDAPGTWPPSRNFGRQERASAAAAVFMQNRYVLATPPYTWIYDFQHNAGYFDDMTGLPYDNEDDGDSDGYMCMSRIFADREFEVALYSPGIGDNTPIGDLYVMSQYPLTQSNVGVAEPFKFTYQTRALDGAGVHRARLKRAKKVMLFGTVQPMTTADGTVTAPALVQGTISLVLENGLYTFPVSPTVWYFDNIQQSGSDYAGRYWSRDQVQGKLFEQELPADCTGRIIQALVQGTTVNGLFTMSDLILEYDPV